jgi:cysteine-rich repeat protein
MRIWTIVLSLVACAGKETGHTAGTPTTSETETPPTTGLSDPLCGDGELGAEEACDDGNLVGGDGCTPWCAAEDGPAEVEANDDFASATPLVVPSTVYGHLWGGDRDCFSFDVPENGAVEAIVTRDGACDPDVIVDLVDAADGRMATGLPGADGCGALDPNVDTFARYLPAGSYAACVQGAFGEAVDGYALSVVVYDSCTDLPPLTPEPSQDRDLDGTADACDPDDDNDGVDDVADNCPDTPNGVGMSYDFSTWDSGFFRQMLVLGPFTDGVTPGGCEPSLDAFAAKSDADAAPMLGDAAPDGTPWRAWLAPATSTAVMDFLTWYSAAAAPREAYGAAWFELPEARDLELTFGPDDGIRVWVDGVEIGSIAGCQGIYTDAFVFPASLEAGWHRVVVKVYDGGGGWGVISRLRYPDGTPMTDVAVSLSGPELWVDDQRDGDGDGVGDVCDDDPTG